MNQAEEAAVRMRGRHRGVFNQLHEMHGRDLKYISERDSCCFEHWVVDLITQNISVKTLNKNTVFKQAWSMFKELYFVDKGCIRMYYSDQSGKECAGLTITWVSLEVGLDGGAIGGKNFCLRSKYLKFMNN